MKFSKSNNPNKRKRAKRKSPYSDAYIAERRKELESLLAKAKTDAEKEMLIKAFEISINP